MNVSYNNIIILSIFINISFFLVNKYNRDGDKKPAVPKKDEKPIMGLVSDKNFIVANAVENILAGKFL